MTVNNGSHSDKNGYRYSYSGSDCKAFAFRNGSEKKLLESMQTISFSIHEAKGQARALGFKSVKGFSRSIRQIAGTMIFTVIEDHPLACMMDKTAEGWSVDQGMGRGTWSLGEVSFDKRKIANKIATLIAPFNIMLVYATESWSGRKVTPAKYEQIESASATDKNFKNNKVDNGYYLSEGKIEKGSNSDVFNTAGLVLSGIEIITEGIVTSVNDMITEVQIQFVARDVKELSLGQYEIETEIDISYDIAYEILKKQYEKEESFKNYEFELEKYENMEEELNVSFSGISIQSSFEGNTGMNGTFYTTTTETQNLLPSTHRRSYSNPYGASIEEHEIDDFYYNPETGEYSMIISTSRNPVLFDEGDK